MQQGHGTLLLSDEDLLGVMVVELTSGDWVVVSR